MGKEYLIDSNAVIDFCSGKLPEKGKELLFSIEKPVISIVTHIEVLGFFGIEENEECQMRDFISISEILLLDMDVALRTIGIRQKNRIKLPDAVIAASAITHGLGLITRNVNDFKNIPDLELVNPWEI